MRISVIIPTYNSEKTIGKLIESLLRQTVQPLEIIVVDGNSTDSTEDVCAAFKSKLIRFIKNPSGHETGTNRNIGADSAKGDHLLFLDSDCTCDKDLIKAYVEEFSKDPNTDSSVVCVAGNVLVANPGDISNKAYISERFLLYNNLKDGFIKGTFFWVMNFCIRKDKFIRFPDTSYSEDMVFIEKLFKTGMRVKFCKSAIAYHTYVETEEAFFRKRLKTAKGFIEQKESITDIKEGSYFDIILRLLKLDTEKIIKMIKDKSICLDKSRGVVLDGHATNEYRFQNILLLSTAVAVLEYKGIKLEDSYEKLIREYCI